MSDITFLCSALRMKLEHTLKGTKSPITASFLSAASDQEQVAVTSANYTEGLRQCAQSVVDDLDVMTRSVDANVVAQLTHKLESATRKIGSLNQLVGTQTGQLDALRSQLKDSLALSEKAARESERKER
jgi:hypothetical protein